MTETYATRNPQCAPRDTQYATQLRDRLSAHPEIAFAYLHGSFVEGLPYHDIDVAVYLDPTWTGDVFEYEMSLSTELTLALRVTVDVHALNGAPLGFCHSVLQGEVLFSRDEEALANYIEGVSLEYMDYFWFAQLPEPRLAMP
jgi:hypothetical protein